MGWSFELCGMSLSHVASFFHSVSIKYQTDPATGKKAMPFSADEQNSFAALCSMAGTLLCQVCVVALLLLCLPSAFLAYQGLLSLFLLVRMLCVPNSFCDDFGRQSLQNKPLPSEKLSLCRWVWRVVWDMLCTFCFLCYSCWLQVWLFKLERSYSSICVWFCSIGVLVIAASHFSHVCVCFICSIVVSCVCVCVCRH